MNTKSQAAALVASGLGHETFHHATLGHFNITMLREVVRLANEKGKLKIHKCRFDEMQMVDDIKTDAFAYLIANREIDYARVKELTDSQIREPLIYALCPPGANGVGQSHLLLDGIHRLVARKQRGKTFFRFYLTPLHMVPLVDESKYLHVPWGEKEVVPGVGLVRRTSC